MIPYSKWAPTPLDTKGLNLPERQDWLVACCIQTRDSDALERSNFRTLLRGLKEKDSEGQDHEVHRFGHWGPGWVEIVLVRPDTAAATEAEECESALADYPVLCDHDFSELEQEDANQVWRDCYRDRSRLEYIRDHRSQFEFRCFSDLMACVRGKYFAGYASELLS